MAALLQAHPAAHACRQHLCCVHAVISALLQAGLLQIAVACCQLPIQAESGRVQQKLQWWLDQGEILMVQLCCQGRTACVHLHAQSQRGQ